MIPPPHRTTLFPYTTLFRSYWLDVPFVHRIHENPDEEKLEHFFEFLAGIGYQIKGTKESTHPLELQKALRDRKSTRLNSSHVAISYAVFCLKKKNNI